MNDYVKNKKKNLRHEYLRKRNSLSESEIYAKSNSIINCLLQLDIFNDSNIILSYINYGSEVQTTPLANFILEKKEKRLFTPKVVGDELKFFEIYSLTQLSQGYKGILEPEVNERNIFSSNDYGNYKILVIVPGVVFDNKGNRIGYGKGFYDRFLKKFPLQTVALTYECQITSFIPTDDNDISINLIVTEERIIQ